MLALVPSFFLPRGAGSVRQWLVAVCLAVWAVGCASLPANVERTPSQAFASPQQTMFGQLVADRRARERAHADSGFALLASVDAAFAGRLALIQGAQRTLDLQYYAIHADGSTELLLEQLRQAARRGVRVRILLDDFNTVGKDTQVLRLAFEPNVQLRLFNPLPGSRQSLVGRIATSLHDMDRVQKRMHNKLFIGDNAIGITGGRNLGDAYFGGDDKSNFVDLDVLAAGRVVRDMSASFDHFWNDELAYPMQTLVTAKELEELRKPASEPSPEASQAGPLPVAAASTPSRGASATVLPNVSPERAQDAKVPPLDLRTVKLTWAPSVLLADKPGKIGPDDDEADAGETVVDGLLQLMRGAKQEITIVSPYFVPGDPMMAAFRALRARNVRVRVLTNSLASNDAPAAHAGYARYRKDLLGMGVELYELRATQEGGSRGLAGSAGSGNGNGRGSGLGSAGGGSKSNVGSKASLHSKAVVIDGRLAVIGSMNLDLRSQKKNSEVALLVRSAAFARDAQKSIQTMMDHDAYAVVLKEGSLLWRAPPNAGFRDATSEPDASAKQKALVHLIAPFAPDEML